MASGLELQNIYAVYSIFAEVNQSIQRDPRGNEFLGLMTDLLQGKGIKVNKRTSENWQKPVKLSLFWFVYALNISIYSA